MGFLPLNKTHLKLFIGSWVILIALLSCTPGNYIPEVDWDFLSPDTIAHFTFYFFLALPILLYIGKPWHWGMFLGVVLGCSLYGLGIEYVQENFIPGRFFDIKDVIINTVGAFMGGISYVVIRVIQ